jgi:peptide/nickel transport system permease protein
MAIRYGEFIQAAVMAGAGPVFIIRTHILRNVAPLVLVQVGISIAYAMLLETSLSFLGLGVQPPAPSWGRMLARAQVTLTQSPLYAIMPGLALSLVVVSVNLFVDAIRDAVDPRLSQMRIAEIEQTR